MGEWVQKPSTGNGRPPEASSSIRQYQRDNPDIGYDGKAVTHEPDCCLGNPGDRIGGVGDARINSSIGSQNKRNAREVRQQLEGVPDEAEVKVKSTVEDPDGNVTVVDPRTNPEGL